MPSRRPRPRVAMAVLAVVALVAGAIALAPHLLSGPTSVGGSVGVPEGGIEARPDQLPDLRARPEVTCDGAGVPPNCTAWTFTLPPRTGPTHAVSEGGDTVVVRDRDHVWVLDLATGDERWAREERVGVDGPRHAWVMEGRVVLPTRTGFLLLDASSGDVVASHHPEGRLIDVWAHDGRVVTSATLDDDILVQAWDAVAGDPLWETPISTASPRHHVGGELVIADGALVITIHAGVTDGVPGVEHVALDLRTGEPVDLPDPGAGSPWEMLDGSEVTIDHTGTRIQGMSPSGTVTWERTLDVPVFPSRPLPGNRASLVAVDGSVLMIIDGATGEDLVWVHVGNGRLATDVWRAAPPWLLSVHTADAVHVVGLELGD